MKRRTAIYLLALCLMLWAPAAAEEEVEIHGEIDLGLRFVDQDEESAKFGEFQDLDDGVFGSFRIDASKDTEYLSVETHNPGLDDQSYSLTGGRYGKYKIKLYYDELPHQLSNKARTFYTGIGSSRLTYFAVNRPKDTDPAFVPAISTNVADWDSFDYSIDRETYGLGTTYSFDNPFYVRFSAEQVRQEGAKHLGAQSGVFEDQTVLFPQISPFGNITDMPEPIDYTTNNLELEGGYKTKDLTFNVRAAYSSFENDNEQLIWRNPYVSTEDFYEENYLPPDNDFYSFSAKLTKRLPQNSLLAMKFEHSRTQSEVDLANTIANTSVPPSGAASPVYESLALALSDNTFDGDVIYTKASVTYNSRPTANLDAQVYYNYLDRQNESDEITYASGGSSITNHPFEYDRHRIGFDIGYRLPRKSKLSGGYEFCTLDRTREDAEETKDHKIYLQLRNNVLDWMSFRIRAEHLDREADQNYDPATIAGDAAILQYIGHFDVTDKKEDSIKLTLEAYLQENLDLGLEYEFRINDYDEYRLGLQKDTRHELYLDAKYSIPKGIELSAFLGYEFFKGETNHRSFLPAFLGGDPDPGNGTVQPPAPLPPPFTAPPVRAVFPESFNWADESTADYFTAGVTVGLMIIPEKLDLIFSSEYQSSIGDIEFDTEGTVPLEDISDSDDYYLFRFGVKALHSIVKNITLTFGYAYEKSEYEDIKLENYQYANDALFSSWFLSGAYTDQDYEAHIGYLAISYLF